MRKAFTTGITTGIILSLIFISGTYIKKLFPADSLLEDIIFLLIFFGIVIITLWISLNRYRRFTNLRWGSLCLTAIIATMMAAGLVGVSGYLYTRYINPQFLSELENNSKVLWEQRNYSLTAISGSTHEAWFQTPAGFAFYHFQDTIIVLGLLSLLVSSVYYIKNKNRLTGFHSSDNHELIF